MKFFNWRKNDVVPVAERVPPTVVDQPAPVEKKKEVRNVSLDQIEEFAEALGVVTSSGGPVVTAANATRVSAVYACARLLAGAIASLPVKVFEKKKDGERVHDAGHVLNTLFNLQPTPLMSAAMFWEYIVFCMLMQGDGYAYIDFDGFGDIREIVPLNPLDVVAQRKGNGLVYYVRMPDNSYKGFEQESILHFAGFGFNGERSLSVIRHAAAKSIGLAMSMDDFAGDFFENGAHQDIALINRGKQLDTAQKNSLREAWSRTYAGAGKSRAPLVLNGDQEIKELSINAADSQLLESRAFQINDIARAFGVPSFMINETSKNTAWGTGMAEFALAFVQYTLSPHTNRWQQEINRKLFLKTSHYCEFVFAGLLRGTTAERNKSYREAVGGSQGPGWMTVNEIRKIENLPAHDDGNNLFSPNDAVLKKGAGAKDE